MANTVKVSAADGTLYHVACRELGDATQWWRIAQLNGLTDPDLSPFTMPVTLTLPTPDQTQNAGIPDYTS
ncbi:MULTISPECIES: hypothetical protein [Acetobacter]|uniref:LysM domain-containing protein n=1 Tax=Acetobacter ascendens TaxID=481146 RepID=A0A1D8QXR3_9PROT|nr:MULTISPECIES: hypothetical protein [Acetobacter]KDE19658.1 hypothetical protein AZ09_10320 [Acetobacter aceti 1023]GBR55785.1 hypothetical protein AA18889_0321 [Acetobacter senegalensis DSM 18889]AOW47120.1 hypothetical protein A4S02_10500 [Acetobacter ascendens]ARW09940.1 hypothetical protein S101447_00838 [Acetobacter ascendens]QHM91988.1 hypothetical protein FCN51_10750 [Acetobacter pasteurianus]